MSHKIKNLFVKLFCLFSCIATNSEMFWVITKLINKIFGNKIESFFICYSAESKYLKYFLFDWLIRKYHWRMVWIGFHFQSGKFGLNFILIVDESDLTSDENYLKLSSYNQRMIQVKDNLKIPFINYAGIIPSLLSKAKQQTSQSASPQDIANVIVKATQDMEKKYNLTHSNTTIFLLGGFGFIGQKYYNEALKLGYKIVIIEKDPNGNQEEIFKNNKNEINLIVNISRKGVLEGYMHFLDNSYIVLNEVYPEPKIPEKLFKACYHVKGIKAFMFPSLPHGYSNALPCCALIPSNKYEVLLTEVKPFKKKN